MTGGLLRLPAQADLMPNARFLSDQLRGQLPLPLIAGGLAGLLWHARARPWRATGLLGIVLLLSTFVFLFPPAVWAPAVLLPVFLALVAGLALLAQALTKDSRSHSLLATLFLVAALLLAWQNWPFVHEVTTDPTGTELISSLERLQNESREAPAAIVAIPWGTHYFAAAFGQRVAERLPGLQLVDHRADFRQLACADRPLLTPVFTHNYWPLEWWQNQLGPVRLDEVAADFVQVCPSQQVADSAPAGEPFTTGVGINLWADVTAGTDEALLTLWWQPLAPVTADYSVAVHLVAHDPPQGPADLLTQADTIHPIDGWYPTSRWQAGEVIRDVYRIPISPDQTPAALRVALYRQNEAGEFVNSEWMSLPLR